MPRWLGLAGLICSACLFPVSMAVTTAGSATEEMSRGRMRRQADVGMNGRLHAFSRKSNSRRDHIMRSQAPRSNVSGGERRVTRSAHEAESASVEKKLGNGTSQPPSGAFLTDTLLEGWRAITSQGAGAAADGATDVWKAVASRSQGLYRAMSGNADNETLGRHLPSDYLLLKHVAKNDTGGNANATPSLSSRVEAVLTSFISVVRYHAVSLLVVCMSALSIVVAISYRKQMQAPKKKIRRQTFDQAVGIAR